MAASTGKKNTQKRKSSGSSAKSSSAKSRQSGAGRPQAAQESAVRSEVLLIVSFALAILLFLCNFGIIGAVGDAVSGVLFGLMGVLAYVFPVLLFVAMAFGLANRGQTVAVMKLAAGGILFALAGIAFTLIQGDLAGMDRYRPGELYELGSLSHAGGGVLFGSLAYGLYRLLDMAGTVFVLLVAGIVCLVIVTERSFVSGVKKGSRRVYETAREENDRRRQRARQRREEQELLREQREQERILRMDKKVSGVMLDTTLERREEPVHTARDDVHEIVLTGAGGKGSAPVIDFERVRQEMHEVGRAETTDETAQTPLTGGEMTELFAPGQGGAETAGQESGVAFAPGQMPGADGAGRTAEQEAMLSELSQLVRQNNRTEDALWGMPEPRTEATAAEQEADPASASFSERQPRPASAGGTFAGGASAGADSAGGTFAGGASAGTASAGNVFAGGASVGAASAGNAFAGGASAGADSAGGAFAGGASAGTTSAGTSSAGMASAGGAPARPASAGSAMTAGSAAENSAAAANAAPQRPLERQEYHKPPLSLLRQGEKKGSGDTSRQLKETAAHLQQTLATFGVKVTVTDISQGPTVTRYELQPEPGVKVSRIVNLADDIKLNLAATDIRIEAPIPGKSAVGIEVPNKENAAVALRDLLESKKFQEFPSSIAFAVGKDIGGQTVVADIAKMPHMLIAGSTGSGKSVCINTIIMSILYKAHPDDVKLIMVDPKVVELSVYNGIPHLLIPVVTEPKKAAGALHWGVAEMTDRYKRFADYNVRDLKGYNQKVEAMRRDGDASAPPKMPQIVIIVDELADLMMVAPGEVEEAICRLAQLARAAGIHLIIATQRPSVDVITGLIKANMPSRVAFAVSSGVDSRTILDMNGAEKLLGKGDMLFFPQGYPKPARIQGAFVSDKEVSDVVEFLKNQKIGNLYSRDIEEQIQSAASAAVSGGDGEAQDRDSYFAEAARFIIDKDKASIGMLQRVFKIGFNRAARIMDQLCEAGVVGEEEGTKPRKVLMSMEQLDAYLEEN